MCAASTADARSDRGLGSLTGFIERRGGRARPGAPLPAWSRRGVLWAGASVVLITLLSIAALLMNGDQAGADGPLCRVSEIADGDSFECDDSRRVRLLLIDAPELAQGPFGEMARETLLELMPVGSSVTLELDVEREDRFGRTLAYALLPDRRIVNEELLLAGAAVVLVYPPNVRYVERFRQASEEARAARRGLWAIDAFECLPVDFRAGAC